MIVIIPLIIMFVNVTTAFEFAFGFILLLIICLILCFSIMNDQKEEIERLRGKLLKAHGWD